MKDGSTYTNTICTAEQQMKLGISITCITSDGVSHTCLKPIWVILVLSNLLFQPVGVLVEKLHQIGAVLGRCAAVTSVGVLPMHRDVRRS